MLAIYVLIVTSYFSVHNAVQILRGPHSIIKYKSIIYPWIESVFMFFLYSDMQHSMAVKRQLCCALEKNSMVGAWHGKCESDMAALWERHILNP